MNEHESEPAAVGTPETDSPVAKKPSTLRTLLFAILGVMVIALIYEYGFVRPSYTAAQTAIDDLMERRYGTEDEGPVTPEIVRAEFGKEPVSGLENKGDYHLEHYRWRRGLPWQTYDIYVSGQEEEVE